MSMAKRLRVLLVVLTVIFTGMGTESGLAEEIRPLQSILNDVERHIGELTINLDDIRKRIDFLQNLPVTHDKVIQELRALDLQGWTLHLEQWELQLEHLQFTKTMLRKVQGISGEPHELRAAWRLHEGQYRTSLEGYRRQRDTIEERRLITEGRMFERYLP
ncbi:MAG: hypothetical protein NPIRA06_02330 [Nitrospirales bacterium]|nr:MAG: hypothetical protein NPIRA06_02330 [Nitrospirales bacterium]